MTYLYIMRDKENGVARAEISRFGLADNENADIMFRVSVTDTLAAHRLIDDLNLPMMTFGDPDVNRVDKSIYYDVLSSRNRIAGDLKLAEKTIDEQARIIRENNAKVASMEIELVHSRNYATDVKTSLKNLMSALAVDAVLERTHQQRNALMRSLVRMIKNVIERGDLIDDDIPF